ncbi:MAG: ABC transporter permease [Candidatus Rokubacteria bacterium]|nr:ABC transporter permease [Candidatus Rokubacteria bacterium]
MRFLVLTAKRFVWFVPTVGGLIAIVFVVSHVIPADPAALIAGATATEAHKAAVRAQYGFDKPLVVQLGNYYLNLVQGDLGKSLFTTRPVAEDLFARLPATIELTFVAMLVAVVVGTPLGVLAALRRNSAFDHVVRLVTVSGLAIASFWLGLMLQWLFAMKLGWTPLRGRIEGFPPPGITGLLTVDALLGGDVDALASALWHLALPTLTLAFPALATVVRFTRAGVLETIQSAAVQYQRSMGIPWTVIVWKYILRGALTSTVTQIGLLFGLLLGGAIVIETVFDWPGIGSYAFNAILQSDYNAVMGFTLYAGVMFILANLAVDLAHVLIDPRETRG